LSCQDDAVAASPEEVAALRTVHDNAIDCCVDAEAGAVTSLTNRSASDAARNTLSPVAADVSRSLDSPTLVTGVPAGSAVLDAA
jgi:hypothetical protein